MQKTATSHIDMENDDMLASSPDQQSKRRRTDDPAAPVSPECKSAASADESEETENEEEEIEQDTPYGERIEDLRNLLHDVTTLVPQKRMQEFAKLRNRCQEVEQVMRKKKVCLFGANGNGKSYLINMLLMLTSCLSAEYQQGNEESLGAKKETAEDDDKNERRVKTYSNTSSPSNDIDLVIEKYTRCTPLFRKQEKNQETFGNQLPSYLLPSKNLGSSLTPCAINLVYSRRYYMEVEYLSKEELLEDAGPWISCQRGGNSYKKKFREMRSRYDAVVADEFKTVDGKIPDYVTSTDDIRIKPGLEKVAGNRYRFKGNGKDLHNDRQFIRDKLDKLLEQEIFKTGVKSVKIGVPSTILQEVDQITDCPGD